MSRPLAVLVSVVLTAGLVTVRAAEPADAEKDADTWWSLKPIVKPMPPAVPSTKYADWPHTPIDRFVLTKLLEKGLEPAPPADRRTLLRRVTFDLTGLPPTPEEIDTFLADTSPDAYEKVVERLLASPAYGERWSRHWMDVAHYAETHGHDQDRPRPHAWPYRDYLVRSFNADKPYARFVQEQLAGDVLFPGDPDAIVAMGFLATGPWDESSLRDIREDSIDRQIARYLDRDDMVTTALSTFVSTTVHCARCHDHKFDPITQKDYYALQAVFAGVDKAERAYDTDPKLSAKRKQLADEKARLHALRGTADPSLLAPAVQAEAAAWEKNVLACQVCGSVMGGPQPLAAAEGLVVVLTALRGVPADRRSDKQRAELALHVLEQKLDRQIAALPPPQLVYAAASDFKPDGSFKPAGKPRPVHVLKRGDINKPGPEAQPAALACVPGLEARFRLDRPDDEGSRRAALARWMGDPKNVLTWRSIVNRVWHYHFGKGIVETPGDFGRMGAKPTHPELLDWLAADFQQHGGSLKYLHRLIVTSAAYRQSSRHEPRFAEVDNDNRYLWRMNRTRLDAEEVRDAVLLAAGRLDRTMGGPSVKQFNMSPGIHVTPNVDYQGFDVDRPEVQRRAVYRFVFRTLPDPFMEALDCPDSSQLTQARNVSVTAPQALALLNDRFMVRMSEHLAARATKSGADLPAQVEAVYRFALAREPTPKESALLTEYAKKHGLANLCRMVLNCNEFVFVN
jgi:hypothetical protein